MTANQIAYTKAKEEARANLAREAENIRANNLNYETQRRAQEVQRETAHLNAATSLQVTAMNNAVQRENAILNANTQLQIASMQRQTQMETAAINAETSRYVADTNAAASRYNTDTKHGEFIIQANETQRHNVAQEQETRRHNEVNEYNETLSTRAKVGDFILRPLIDFGSLKSLLPHKS
jgi:hypothetical protein